MVIYTQIKGKETENSYQELKRSKKGTGTHKHTETESRYFNFLNQKRVNVCEHTTKTASLESL